MATAGRPAILPPDLAKAADRTRRFRHVAVRTYDQFDPAEAGSAVAAAGILAAGLPSAIKQFRDATGD
jgi:hypothetical protein